MSMEETVSWEKDQQAVNALLLLREGDGSHHMTSTLGAQCCYTLGLTQRWQMEVLLASLLRFLTPPFHSTPHPPSPQPWCLIHLNKYFRGCDLPLGSTCFQESPAERVTLDPCSGVKVPFTWGRKRRGADLPESSSSPSSVPASPGSSPGSA